MDCPGPDPNTRAEVDLMILDYTLCIAISGLLHSREPENVAWSLDLIDTFLLNFQDTESFPDDLRTKLQVFDLTYNFLRYAWPTSQSLSSVEARLSAGHTKTHTKQGNAYGRATPPALSEIVTQFMILCDNAHTPTHREVQMRITARLIMQVALEEVSVPKRGPAESLEKQLPKAVDDINAALTRQLGIDMVIYWSPPEGTPLAAQVEMSSRGLPLPSLQDAMVDFLTDLMEGLEAPVLVQLERGQLQGLSCAETKQLKERVGLR